MRQRVVAIWDSLGRRRTSQKYVERGLHRKNLPRALMVRQTMTILIVTTMTAMSSKTTMMRTRLCRTRRKLVFGQQQGQEQQAAMTPQHRRQPKHRPLLFTSKERRTLDPGTGKTLGV